MLGDKHLKYDAEKQGWSWAGRVRRMTHDPLALSDCCHAQMVQINSNSKLNLLRNGSPRAMFAVLATGHI